MKDLDINVSWKGYMALFVGVLFFSGLFTGVDSFLAIFDFTNVIGRFGRLGMVGEEVSSYVSLANDFRGAGGVGARDGFMLAVTFMPAALLALGTVSVIEHFGGLIAAAKLMSPVLKPFVGIPGTAGLALIGSLYQADVGGMMTADLFDRKLMDERERLIFVQMQCTAGGTMTNYMGTAVVMFPYLAELGMPVILPLILLFGFKVISANIMRYFTQISVEEALIDDFKSANS